MKFEIGKVSCKTNRSLVSIIAYAYVIANKQSDELVQLQSHQITSASVEIEKS